MADDTVRGTIIDGPSRKDGTNDRGDWTLWRFQLQDHETGSKNYYSWGDEAEGGKLKNGHAYAFTYYTTDNKTKPEYPHRNIRALVEEIEAPDALAEQEQKIQSRGDYQRSKEEMRWTEAMHMAVNLIGSEGATVESILPDTIREWTDWFYRELLAAPSAPASQNNPSNRRETTEEPASGDAISPEHATQLMQMADDLMETGGRKWVMQTIKDKWGLSQPGELTHKQADEIAALLNGGDE